MLAFPIHILELRVKIFALFFILLAPLALGQESYDTLLHHWSYDQGAPLNVTQAGVQKREGVSIYDISFASPVNNRSTFVGRTVALSLLTSLCLPDLVHFQQSSTDTGACRDQRRKIAQSAGSCHYSSGFCARQHAVERPTDRSGGAAEREPSPRRRSAAGSQRR